MTLKHRLTKLEKDNQPEPAVQMTLQWGDCDETPAEKAKRIASRPTHTPEGDKIEYVDLKWGDENDA